MEFSVVGVGYDRSQVDSCLADLAERLARVAARVEAASEAAPTLAPVCAELSHLRDLLCHGADQPDGNARRLAATVQEAQLLTRARAELAAAQEEARLVRDRVYAEALQARRDFEAALYARRLREQWVDELLRSASVGAVASARASEVVATSAAPAGIGAAVTEERDRTGPGGQLGGTPGAAAA